MSSSSLTNTDMPLRLKTEDNLPRLSSVGDISQMKPFASNTRFPKLHSGLDSASIPGESSHSSYISSTPTKETHEILNTSDSFKEQDLDTSLLSSSTEASNSSSIRQTVPMLIMSDTPKHERFNKPVPTLCYNGHIYRKVPVSSFKERLEWECSKRREFGCGALVTTDYNLEGIELEVRHCHAIIYSYIEAVNKASQNPSNGESSANDTRQTSGTKRKGSIEYADDTSDDDTEVGYDYDDDNDNEIDDPTYSNSHEHKTEAGTSSGAGVVKVKEEFPKEGLNVDILVNNKGGMTLFYKGYQYNKNGIRGKKIRWECSKKKKFKCHGSLFTDLELRNEQVVGNHTHPVSEVSLEVHRARSAMKEQVNPFSGVKHKDIFQQELAKCSKEAQESLLASKDAILRFLNHRKQKLIEESGIELPNKSNKVKEPLKVLTQESEFYRKKELIQGKNGKVKMYFEGYLYTIKSNIHSGRKKIRWECAKKAFHHCKGAVLSDENYDNVTMTVNHTHQRQTKDLEVLKLRNQMKKSAYDTDMKTSAILQEHLQGVSEDLRKAVGSTELLTKMVNRIKMEKALKREAEGGEPVPKKIKKGEQNFVEDTPHWSIIFKKEILKNNRGGVKIAYEGYMYTKKGQSKHRLTWECSQRRAFRCTGSLATDKDYNNPRMTSPHTHERSTTAAEITRIRQNMKDRMLQTLDTPGKILSQELDHLPEEIRSQVGTKESLKRVLRNIKQMALRGEDCTKVNMDGVEVVAEADGDDMEMGAGAMDIWKPVKLVEEHGKTNVDEDHMADMVPLGLKETNLNLDSYQDKGISLNLDSFQDKGTSFNLEPFQDKGTSLNYESFQNRDPNQNSNLYQENAAQPSGITSTDLVNVAANT